MNAKYTKVFAGILIATGLYATTSMAESSFATVNGVGLPQSQLDFTLKAKVGAQAKNPEVVKNVKQALINRELIVQEAKKKGLDRETDVVRMIEDARQEIIAQNYYANFMKSHPITDADVKKQYDSMKAQTGDTEYSVKHILVEKEDEAKSIISKLASGSKFETLAKEHSKDGSKERGGDLGWNVPNSFVKPFADEMVKLSAGSYSKTPVKSEFGYHIIKVESSRKIKTPSFEQAKLQIRNQLQKASFAQHVDQLRKNAKVQ